MANPGPKCTAKRRDGQPCTKRPMRGGTVCDTHGGLAPQVRQKAAIRQLDMELRGMLAKMEISDVTNPAAELARSVGITVGFRDLLISEVDALTSWTTLDDKGAEQAKALVTLLTWSIAESNKALLGLHRAGIDAATLGHVMAQPSREQAESLNRILTGLDLTPEQQTALPELFRKEGLIP